MSDQTSEHPKRDCPDETKPVGTIVAGPPGPFRKDGTVCPYSGLINHELRIRNLEQKVSDNERGQVLSYLWLSFALFMIACLSVAVR